MSKVKTPASSRPVDKRVARRGRAPEPVATRVDTRVVLIVMALLVIVTIAAYSQVTKNGFVLYDDPDYVKDNPNIKQGVAHAAQWAFSLDFLKQGGRAYAANYHPLTWVSHAIDYQRYGMDAGKHHATSLALHVLSTVLLFLALTKMTRSPWKSAFVAALFALHPTHVESVAWAAERKDTLSTFFWMATMLAYAYYAESRGTSKLGFYGGVIVCFILGLLSKPMVVTLPLVLLMLDFWPLRRLAPESKFRTSIGMLILEKIPLFVLSIISCVVTFFAQDSGGAVNKLEALTIPMRLATAFSAYLAYIGKMIWPTKLAVFYPLLAPKPGQTPEQFEASLLAPTALYALALIAITAVVVYFGRKRGYLTIGWLWYVVTLIPVIGLVQVGEQSMADRYTYIPLTGLFVMIAWLIPDLFAKPQALPEKAQKSTEPFFAPTWWLGVPAGLIVLCCLILTTMQVSYWRDSETLFGHAIKVNPNNYLAYTHLGGYYDTEKHDLAKAEVELREALRVKPNYARAHNSLGNILSQENRLDEALTHYEESLDYAKNDHVAMNNLAIIYGKKAQETQDPILRQQYLEKACAAFREVTRINPGFKNAYCNLGYALSLADRNDEAVAAYLQALAIDPYYVTAHSNLGGLLTSIKRYDEALEHLQTAVQLEPTNMEAQGNLARCYKAMGRNEEARQTLETINKMMQRPSP